MMNGVVRHHFRNQMRGLALWSCRLNTRVTPSTTTTAASICYRIECFRMPFHIESPKGIMADYCNPIVCICESMRAYTCVPCVHLRVRVRMHTTMYASMRARGRTHTHTEHILTRTRTRAHGYASGHARRHAHAQARASALRPAEPKAFAFTGS